MKNSKASEIFKHPLLLMVVGAILSYLIIPAISSISDNQRKIKELKLDLAYRIIDQNTEVSKNLNSLYVTLALFRKDHEHVTNLSSLNASRELTHSDMLKLYLHFDSEAWFWEANYILKSYTSELESESINSLKTSIRNYQDNVSKSTTFIDTLWKSTLRTGDYFQPTLKNLFASAKDSLRILSKRRNQNVKNIVMLLTESG
jgi:hypothetical protein